MRRYPMKKGELVQSESPGGWTVYEAESDSLHVLNASAKAIWELCDGATTSGEMATAISELTGIDGAAATSQVEETLRVLDELGLIAYRD